MARCNEFEPDVVYRRFKIVEFPISYVGLSTTQYLNVEVDLDTFAYIKTSYNGKLWEFEKAREVSASHRAYIITRIDKNTLKIIFKPINECIAKVMTHQANDNRFLFDLRLIKVEGTRCCNEETHSEIGRYYVSGQYEFINITHHPKVISYDDVVIHNKVLRHVRIRNESKNVAAKFRYIKVTNFDVLPKRFTIPPGSTKKIQVYFKPSSEMFPTVLPFTIRNAYDDCDDDDRDHCDDNNFISYTISTDAKLVYNFKRNEILVESLHHIKEQNPHYTFLNQELIQHNQRQIVAKNIWLSSKTHNVSALQKVKISSKREKCESKISLLETTRTGVHFCNILRQRIYTYFLLQVTITPFKIDFGRIGLKTYGKKEILITNDTPFCITISMLSHNYVVYTKEKRAEYKIKLEPFSKSTMMVLCFGSTTGRHMGSFNYLIDQKFHKSHNYSLEVGQSLLMIEEQSLKFGMVTSEAFVTCVPIRIYNNFNIGIDFEWKETNSDVPFQVTPINGTIPQNSCKICDITYICKFTKSKTHEMELISKGQITKTIPIEINIMTRKLSIKFLQAALTFKDIALNIEAVGRVRLENSSREIAFYTVLEPVVPGIIIEPMNGVLKPKTIITFSIKAKFSCLVEFEFDMLVRINNKETLVLPISGSVVEPKLVVHPKYVYMPRVPNDMVTYVPVTFQNTGTLRSTVEVLDLREHICDSVFQVFFANGLEKIKLESFFVDPGQSKTVFVKVHNVFRREYDMYIPFRINGLLGPPVITTPNNSWSLELHHYTGRYEELYENNPKVHVKSVTKDIANFRIAGVITVPWIELSVNKFEIEYNPGGDNSINFTMTNVSKYCLHITIVTSKISPNFSLDITKTEDSQSIANENHIKLELNLTMEAKFCLKFHPKGHGKFIAVAVLFLDKAMTIPYSNLTFIGKRHVPEMTASVNRLIFPICYVGTEVSQCLTIKLAIVTDLDLFHCSTKEEPCIKIEFEESEIVQDEEQCYTVVKVNVKVCCKVAYTRNLTLRFHHECGSGCEVNTHFCFTYCPITLHTRRWVSLEDDPYPYYPQRTQTDLFEYMEKSKSFLERWLFQQGFRRDLFPEIPETFFAISSAISISAPTKFKGMNVSFLNFMRRIAGPLMKHVHKVTIQDVDEPLKTVMEIHDTYRQIIHLLRSRGGNALFLKAKFLLSHNQFLVYTDGTTSRSNSDAIMIQEFRSNADLFYRLNKQTWMDLIIQSYKVFVMDSCFFDCVCLSSQPRDIVQVLIAWYNENIRIKHYVFGEQAESVKIVANLVSDLSDGVAIMSVLLVHCPFLKDHFSLFCNVDEEHALAGIIHNACLIIEAMNQLRLFFPLSTADFVEPNFLHMLFLSLHLFVVLPMLKPKETVLFCPPLLRSSIRQIVINPTTQETLTYTFTILHNNTGCFLVERTPIPESGKKFYLTIKYKANFIRTESAYLLVHGFNKARIFDTYVMFHLIGKTGALYPMRKCKVTGALYRPSKVDIIVSSPFASAAAFKIFLTDVEPCLPIDFGGLCSEKRRFYLRRLNLIDKEIILAPKPLRELSSDDKQDSKVYLQMICLSTLPATYYIWFRSDVGEFFMRVSANCRWDMALDSFQVKVKSWPMDPCSCGEACECYRSTIVMIPHRNDLMLKALRNALIEYATGTIMDIYDQLIMSTTGHMILLRLLEEGGTNMSDVEHILQRESSYRISSRTLEPRVERVTLAQHSDAMLALPVTVPPNHRADKYTLTFTSDTGADIRTYRIIFIETPFGE